MLMMKPVPELLVFLMNSSSGMEMKEMQIRGVLLLTCVLGTVTTDHNGTRHPDSLQLLDPAPYSFPPPTLQETLFATLRQATIAAIAASVPSGSFTRTVSNPSSFAG